MKKNILLIIFVLCSIFIMPAYTSSFAEDREFRSLDKDEVACIKDVEISPKISYYDSVITITAKVSNPDPKTTDIVFTFLPPSYDKLKEIWSNRVNEQQPRIFTESSPEILGTKRIKIPLYYDKTKDLFIGTYQIKLNDEMGLWRLESVVCEKDGLGSNVFWWPELSSEAVKTFRTYYFNPDPEQIKFSIKNRMVRELRLFNVLERGKYGYIDQDGELIIEPKYQSAAEFNEDLALVSVDNRYGYISMNGLYKIDLQFNQAFPFSEGLAGVKKDEKYGYIDKNGQLKIDAEFDYVGKFIGGLACVKAGDKFGFIDVNGSFVIPAVYENARDVSNNLIAVYNMSMWGFIDKTGKTIINLSYNKVTDFSENMAGAKKGGKWGYISPKGKVVIPFMYNFASCFKDGLAAVSLNNKVGYIDKTGKIIIPPQYNIPEDFNLCDFSEGLAAIKVNGLYGFIDKSNKMVIKPQFKSINSTFKNGLAMVSTGSESGYINKVDEFIWKVKAE